MCVVAVRKLTLGSLFLSVIVFSSAHGGDVCSGSWGDGECVAPLKGPDIFSSNSETRFFGGMQWSFGNNAPELIMGVQRIETRTDETVFGGKFDFSLPLTGPKKFDPTVRVLGVAGNRDAQGEAGFGIQLSRLDPLLAIGANFPYINGGMNIYRAQGVAPYAGITTLGRLAPPKRENGELSCASGSLFLITGSDSVPAGDIVNGYTCVSIF